jgi:hypothetical protein
LAGVTIGDDVVVGAGSVVSRDLPSNCVAVGSPAKPIRTLSEYRQRIRALQPPRSEKFCCGTSAVEQRSGVVDRRLVGVERLAEPLDRSAKTFRQVDLRLPLQQRSRLRPVGYESLHLARLRS